MASAAACQGGGSARSFSDDGHAPRDRAQPAESPAGLTPLPARTPTWLRNRCRETVTFARLVPLGWGGAQVRQSKAPARSMLTGRAREATTKTQGVCGGSRVTLESDALTPAPDWSGHRQRALQTRRVKWQVTQNVRAIPARPQDLRVEAAKLQITSRRPLCTHLTRGGRP